MEMFNKIYSQVSSSVSTTVNHLQGVLPGNPVTREFDAVAHIASAGPCLAWKIYKGFKRSTKQEASIFVFEKRQLDKWNKTDKELILETLRKGIIQLTKIRHPQVLTVQHPLEESRESLAFATEPVFASLANILGQTNNMPQPTNLSDFKLYDVEIKYGLLQISEGLAFLHNDMKLLHKNISPEIIIINHQGAWKIFGFDFCVHNTSPPNSVPFFPCEDFSPTLPLYCQPNIEYLAPECVTLISNSTASDMFSLGMLSYTVHSRTSLFPIKDFSQFKNRVQQLKTLNPSKLSCIPEDLRQYVKLLLNVTPELRPDAHQFVKIPYFEDLGVKTLNYLDCLLQWDNLQKSQFYKGLPEALSKLPQRVKVQRVLSCLVRDLSQPTMVPFILPSILDIAQECTQKEFCTYVLPHLKPVMKLMEPIQILLILLQRMELLLKLTPAGDVQQHVLPMLYRGLDSDTPQIHELCLSVLPTFAGLLDHSNVKNSLLPRIKKLCLSTSNLSVRVNCLLCIGRLLEHLDKWLVLDEVLPFLPQIPSREPAVLMGILGIYKLAMHHKKLGITKEIIASRILPFLIPLCIENGLTLTQFNAIVVLVKEMFALVENEHRTKLEQLNSVKDQQRTLAATMPSVLPETAPVELDKAFSGLGLDSFASPSSLQEKTKIVQQQENIKLFKNQSTIELMKASPSNTQPAKDLSSSLMNDFMGLNQSKDFMSVGLSTSSNTVNSNSSPISTNVNTIMNQSMTLPNLNASLISPNSNTNLNWNKSLDVTPNSTNNMMQFRSSFTSPQPTVSPSWSANAVQMTSPSNNAWSNNKSFTPLKTNSSNNWNSLDKLLPLNVNKVPMNQMTIDQQTMPLLKTNTSPINNNSNNNSKTNNITPLSKKDLMDFLT